MKTVETETEKEFHPNRAQRRNGLKAWVKTSQKKTRALAVNHPPEVIDRRRTMAARRDSALAS